MWVANYNNNNVSKFKADGTFIANYAVQAGPYNLVFDGANIWVGNNSNQSVTKLRASDGANLGNFSLPQPQPWGMACDGTYIWVATGAFLHRLYSFGTITGSVFVGGSL
jgi:DNA-binding beta-propeller fold protein YncE